MTMPVFIDNPPRAVVELDGARTGGTVAARRVNASVVGQLLEGRITRADFRKRISRWSSISGHQLLAHPSAAWAVLEQRRARESEPPYRDDRGAGDTATGLCPFSGRPADHGHQHITGRECPWRLLRPGVRCRHLMRRQHVVEHQVWRRPGRRGQPAVTDRPPGRAGPATCWSVWVNTREDFGGSPGEPTLLALGRMLAEVTANIWDEV